MMFRTLLFASLAMILMASAPAPAAKNAIDKTHDGTVVSATSEKLVMTNKEGKEHTYTMILDAKVSCDGNVCKVEELKPGMRIRVTTKSDDILAATRIEALDKREQFEQRD